MNDDLYAVILLFDPDDRELREKIIQRLSQIDPTSAKRIAHLEQGRVTVKKNTNLDTAQRLARVLEKTGATCKIHPQPVVPAASASPDEATPASTQKPQQRMHCPNCESEQPQAHECPKCGVIIDKAHLHQEKKRRIRVEEESRQAAAEAEIAPEPPAQHALVETLKKWGQSLLAVWKKRPIIPAETLLIWWKRVKDRSLTCLVAFIIALVLEIALLYMVKTLWLFYTATGVGRYYVRQFADKAIVIQQSLSEDLLLLSLESTITVLLISLLISAVAKLLHLTRYLFDSQGMAGKLVLWCAPATALSGWVLYQNGHLANVYHAGFAVLLPTLFLLAACMQLVREMVPELGTLWRLLVTNAWKKDNRIWREIKERLSTWIEANF